METLHVNISYRPLRIAWAIKSTDKEAFRRVVRYSHALWGGRFNPIVFADRPDEAKDIIELFRADVVLPVGDAEEVRNFPSRFPHLINPFHSDDPFHHSPGQRAYVQVLDIHNALVHRPYTQRGDIFIKSYPDRLEVVNPGPLPIGVTPATVLHTTARRNEGLARVFHDLKLMDREGSGFDTMYEVLLAQGRGVPRLKEGHDRVEVTVGRRILKPEVIDLLGKAGQNYQLKQREMICFGLLAQAEHLTARELAAELMLDNVDELRSWLGRLQELGLVNSAGRTKATRYFVAPDVARKLDIAVTTTLGRIEQHRLEALVVEDLQRYPRSKIGKIQERIGAEIARHKIKEALDTLHAAGKVAREGEKRGRVYWLAN